MRHPPTTVLLFVCAAWLAACISTSASLSEDDDLPSHTVHVISNGWHTAIIVSRADAVVTGLLPEAAHFPKAAFLEFGWGDRDYYPAERVTLGLTLRAVLTPTPSVMHVAGRARVPEPQKGLESVQVALTEDGFRQMLRAIADSFERPEGSPAEPVGSGLYPGSRFYAARGRFHLFNTCNTWTARMLRASGMQLSPAGVVTANDMMERLRSEIGTEQPAATLSRTEADWRLGASGRQSS